METREYRISNLGGTQQLRKGSEACWCTHQVGKGKGKSVGGLDQRESAKKDGSLSTSIPMLLRRSKGRNIRV
jgi:hypothetical protein